ncbi:hypothetical protein ACHAWC_003050 [Mediolabrus comicus]
MNTSLSWCILLVVTGPCCNAFVSNCNGRLAKVHSVEGRICTQISLTDSPFESTSSVISVVEVAASLQFFYTAALVAGVGYTQRMAGREDFKQDMAAKIATGEVTPEELVDEITVMADEINNAKTFAESAQLEVEKLLEETRAIQQKMQQLPGETLDALNIQKAALAVEEEVAPVKEKVLVTAGGKEIKVLEKVTEAGGGHKEKNLPNTILDGFGVYDDIFEMEGGEEEEEKEWSVPLIAGTEVKVKSSLKTDKESEEQTETVVDNANTPDNGTEMGAKNELSSVSNDEARAEIKQKAEAFRAKIKSLESRIKEEVDDKEPVTLPPTPPRIPAPPLQVVTDVVESTKKPIRKKSPDGPIRSSPLARLLCQELNVELADCYPGSGLKGRVLADDVRNYAKNRDNAAT